MLFCRINKIHDYCLEIWLICGLRSKTWRELNKPRPLSYFLTFTQISLTSEDSNHAFYIDLDVAFFHEYKYGRQWILKQDDDSIVPEFLSMIALFFKTVPTPDKRKQEAIHRLMSIEMDFIDVMHAGMQRYSRPLRHCILNPKHHFTLFQNIEKVKILVSLLHHN